MSTSDEVGSAWVAPLAGVAGGGCDRAAPPYKHTATAKISFGDLDIRDLRVVVVEAKGAT